MKTCTRCLLSKVVSSFSKLARSSDGLSYWCKSCHSAYSKIRNPSKGLRAPKRKIIVNVGDRFSRLTVVSLGPVRKRKPTVFVDCDCGTKGKQVARVDLFNKQVQSCGCLSKEHGRKQMERLRELGTIHGNARTGQNTHAYKTWISMRRRCYDPKNASYHNYGARGITVCERWRFSFENFLADMGEPPTALHTIDRADSSANYGPEQCSWKTRREQAENRGTSVFVTLNGERVVLKEAARRLNVPYSMLWQRHKNGWSEEEMLNTPSRARSKAKRGEEARLVWGA